LRRFHGFGVAVGFALLCLHALAGTARADDEDYTAMVRDAVAEYDAGHYEEAAALFERAHAKSPSARTHRGLGLAYFQARKYVLAVRHLTDALSDSRRPLKGEQRAESERFLKQASRFVGRFTLVLDPVDAVVEVDGHAAEREGDELLLDAGQHELIVHAADREDERRMLEAIAGPAQQLRITLAPKGPSEAQAAAAGISAAPLLPPPQQAAKSAEPASTGRGIGPYLVLGAGGALLIGSAVTGLLANGIYNKLDGRCPKGVCADPKLTSERDSGKTLVVATNVLLVSGLVGVAAGATWWLLAPRGHAETQVAAVCLPGGCAVSVGGRL
jgi:hypothetical protein